MSAAPTPFAVSITVDEVGSPDTADRSQPTVTVRVEGEFDVAVARTFDMAVERVMDLDPVRLVVDLGPISVLDSAGIGAIMRLRKRAFDRKVDFGIDAPEPFQRRLLTITGLGHLIV